MWSVEYGGKNIFNVSILHFEIWPETAKLTIFKIFSQICPKKHESEIVVESL